MITKRMADHERYQTACRICYRVFEADTPEQVIAAVTEHEKDHRPKTTDNKIKDRHDEVHSTT